MPLLVLAARLCPMGVEATLFAFLMSVMNTGRAVSEWWGAALLQLIGVRREKYERLWLAVAIRMACRLLPLLFLWLLPDGGPEDDLPVEEGGGEGTLAPQDSEEQGLLTKGGVSEGGGQGSVVRGSEMVEVVHKREHTTHAEEL